MNTLVRGVVALLAALLSVACAAGAPGKAVPAAKPAGEQVLEITGEVVYLGFEGGFWGIVGSDGKRYDPGKLPPEFQQPGLKVKVSARLVRDRVSFRMWGTPIEVVKIVKSEE